MSRSMRIRTTASAIALTAGCGVATTAFANQDVIDHIAAGDVVMPNYTYDSHNYSPLNQINVDNVANLTVAWTLQLGTLDQYEASPLVVGSTMYIAAPVNQSTGTGQQPNVLLAIDLNTQTILWEFRPDVDREAGLQACCGAQTRGLNYAEGNVYYTTVDGQSFAIDGETGEALWRTLVTDVSIREHNASNAIIVGDLYITGNEGGEYGTRGKVTALDIHTGQTQWVMYSMGPDNEVGIGPRFNPFYDDDKVGSLVTWFGDSWRHGGGTVWGYFAADLERNMFYYSTGNCGPWNPDYRREWGVINLDENGGLIDYRNNWCAGMMARDSTTGELIWAYAITAADPWDIDEPIPNPLVELEIGGQTRDAVIKAARNGINYVWDRDDGELLVEPWPFVYTDAYTGVVNMETGRLEYNIEGWAFTDVEDRRRYTDYEMPGATERDDYTGTEIAVCPGNSARNWENDTFFEPGGYHIVSTDTSCFTQVVVEGEYVAGEGYTLRRGAGGYPGGNNRVPYADAPDYGEPTDVAGVLQAFDVVNRSVAWTVEFPTGNRVAVSSSGDLVWQGNPWNGTVNAYNGMTGEELWAFHIGSQVEASPITYIGPDGRQYVAIVASNANTGQVNFDDAANDADRYRRAGSTLFVFALPQAIAGGM